MVGVVVDDHVAHHGGADLGITQPVGEVEQSHGVEAGAGDLAIALAVMCFGLWAAQSFMPMQWTDIRGWQKALQLGWLVLLGITLYFTSLALLGFRPRDFKRSEV
mgnify:CR=1 FL=1